MPRFIFLAAGKIRKLTRSYDLLGINRLKEGSEGSLPRDLYCVTIKKGAVAEASPIAPGKESEMDNPLDKFQVFMDAASSSNNDAPEPPGKT